MESRSTYEVSGAGVLPTPQCCPAWLSDQCPWLEFVGWRGQACLRISSVQFSRSVVSDSLRPHESQQARPPCPSPTPGVHSKSIESVMPYSTSQDK